MPARLAARRDLAAPEPDNEKANRLRARREKKNQEKYDMGKWLDTQRKHIPDYVKEIAATIELD